MGSSDARQIVGTNTLGSPGAAAQAPLCSGSPSGSTSYFLAVMPSRWSGITPPPRWRYIHGGGTTNNGVLAAGTTNNGVLAAGTTKFGVLEPGTTKMG